LKIPNTLNTLLKKLYATLVLVSGLHCHHVLAQRKQIDSLNKALSLLHDTLHIDCLNEISSEYILAEKKDSAIYFSNLAYHKARKINYAHSIAVSFSHKCQIAKHFDDDFIQSEAFGKKSLSWYERTGNKAGIEVLYWLLMVHCFCTKPVRRSD